ncbi:50S ribosomal protein L30 [Cardinium endosymbiont cEper1 of Encarsia pergandiella]|uniref:50S ribosomal protein L30 n=1 Tax=Cardinium endosymbiont of Encarsia pergandiella TaxID=249402 RepID=UPI00027EAAE4|nr:50S ribosomal protein L30 [Cardinium endosymbiont of Encarsia pergandiella]CCM09912.1 50S ribosomal protein L30 [Cardinium endosymbiont cEper1 of Encarsia pergandiella]
MEQIRITQVRSLIKRPKSQKATIQALGLGRVNKGVVVEATPQIWGMVRKVNHLVVTEKI